CDGYVDQVNREAQKLKLPVDAQRELEPLVTVHHLLLDDPMLIDDAVRLIQNRRYNAEWAVTTQGEQLIEQFNVIADPYLRERQADVRQIGRAHVLTPVTFRFRMLSSV